MSDGTFIAIILLFLSNIMTMWRCNILSHRIDTVHERITLNNRMNGLKSGGWDPEESRDPVGGTGGCGK